MNNDLIYRGDDTNAFGNNLMVIHIHNDTAEEITKVAMRIGTILKEYSITVAAHSDYDLNVNLSQQETVKLQGCSEVYLAAWDGTGLKQTVLGTIKIKTAPEVV